jgi:hypothetical protein
VEIGSRQRKEGREGGGNGSVFEPHFNTLPSIPFGCPSFAFSFLFVLYTARAHAVSERMREENAALSTGKTL